jgi:hypothetical protein
LNLSFATLKSDDGLVSQSLSMRALRAPVDQPMVLPVPRQLPAFRRAADAAARH